MNTNNIINKILLKDRDEINTLNIRFASGYKKKVWNRDNTLKQSVPNKPGIYRFYDKNGNLLYVGHAKKLRHRVQSYRQEDDFNTHPTKSYLRGNIHSFSYKIMPEMKARELEKKSKKKALYNFRAPIP